ncbi:MAG: EamA family transporter [Candidatus Aenigmarchaeota archaeon]|nr:EamA family transporter [Candidatus Aenigmarchaeota archaeon]
MWFIYALLSALFMSSYALLMRKSLKDKGDPIVFALLLNFIITFLLLVTIPFENMTYSFTNSNSIVLVLTIIGTAIVAILFTKGRRLEEASNVSIGAQVGRIWSLVGAALILGEPITTYKMIGVGLVILGNILISWKGQKLKLTRGMLFVISGSLLFATVNFGDKYLLRTFSTGFYNFLLYSFSSIILLAFIRFDFKKIKKEMKLHGPIVFLIGTFFTLGMYFFQLALKFGEVSRVVPVHSSSMIFTILAGIILLKERDDLIKKLIAGAIVFAGVYLLII